jgi:beta-lactamase class A
MAMLRPIALSFLLVPLGLVVGCTAGALRGPKNPQELEAAIERLAESVGGTVGVGARHIETGREFYLNRSVRFPMGSVFKLPLAVQFLALVDQNAVSLEKTVVLQPGDLRAGSGILAKSYGDPRSLSLHRLLETMLIDSDNSATDILWKEAGGSKAVMARLAALGIKEISVDRPTALLLAAAAGIGPVPPDIELTPAKLTELSRKTPRAEREAAAAAFLKDERDTATPAALVDLLSKIWRGEALSADRTALLVDVMVRCETGKGRLRGRLPVGTQVAHKTGTLRPSVTNDAGVIRLPGRAGRLAVVVLIKESKENLLVQERTIAEIARVLYDYFASTDAK